MWGEANWAKGCKVKPAVPSMAEPPEDSVPPVLISLWILIGSVLGGLLLLGSLFSALEGKALLKWTAWGIVPMS